MLYLNLQVLFEGPLQLLLNLALLFLQLGLHLLFKVGDSRLFLSFALLFGQLYLALPLFNDLACQVVKNLPLVVALKNEVARLLLCWLPLRVPHRCCANMLFGFSVTSKST